MWNAGCGSGGGFEYPEFGFGITSNAVLTVVYSPGTAETMNCAGPTGAAWYCTAEWTPASDTLTIYERSGDPTDLTDWNRLTREQQRNIMAHELGHALGVGDPHGTCPGGLMNAFVTPDLSIVSEECQVAHEQNTTQWERSGGTHTCSPWPDCEESPIILDLGRNGYQLTDNEGGVWFDLNGNMMPEKVSWTKAGGDDAFLWLDEDGNGVVSDGRELFGAFELPNGFERLKIWDVGVEEDVNWGGNENGLIDRGDRIWSRLRLWIDSSHDGVSQPSEIFTLDEKNVVAIDLNYRWSGRRDEHGNEFRYRSLVTIRTAEGEAPAPVYDVFLVVKR